MRSLKALNFLRQQGFKFLKSVKAGSTAWSGEIDQPVRHVEDAVPAHTRLFWSISQIRGKKTQTTDSKLAFGQAFLVA